MDSSRRRKSISSLITSSGFFFFFFLCFQKMELDFDAGNLLEDEAAEVGHNVSVNLDLSVLIFVDLIIGSTFFFFFFIF